MPLEQFEPIAAFRMEVDGAPDELPPVIGEFEALLRAAGYEGAIGALGRFEYYERTRSKRGLATRRLLGCIGPVAVSVDVKANDSTIPPPTIVLSAL